MPFTIDTFVDHRYDPPRRVWHPTGDQDDWHALRNRYNNRRLNGQGSEVDMPIIWPNTEALYFRVWPDTFRILIDLSQSRAGRVEVLKVLEGRLRINGGQDADGHHRTAWMTLDPGDIIVRSFDAIPPEHLDTDSFTIRGFIHMEDPTFPAPDNADEDEPETAEGDSPHIKPKDAADTLHGLVSAGQVELENGPGGDTFEENQERILKEVMEETGMPRFLLDYREVHRKDALEYEVSVAVPEAKTHKYQHLREKHRLA